MTESKRWTVFNRNILSNLPEGGPGTASSRFLGDWVLKQTSYFAFHPAKESHVKGHMSALIRAGKSEGGKSRREENRLLKKEGIRKE